VHPQYREVGAQYCRYEWMNSYILHSGCTGLPLGFPMATSLVWLLSQLCQELVSVTWLDAACQNRGWKMCINTEVLLRVVRTATTTWVVAATSDELLRTCELDNQTTELLWPVMVPFPPVYCISDNAGCDKKNSRLCEDCQGYLEHSTLADKSLVYNS